MSQRHDTNAGHLAFVLTFFGTVNPAGDTSNSDDMPMTAPELEENLRNALQHTIDEG